MFFQRMSHGRSRSGASGDDNNEISQTLWHKTVCGIARHQPQLKSNHTFLEPDETCAEKRKCNIKKNCLFIFMRHHARIKKQNLFQSMPRRMQAVVDNQGGNTKY